MNFFSRFNGRSNYDLVRFLKRSGIIITDRVFETMCSVDRAHFLDSPVPYMDAPQNVGFDETICAPHLCAYVLEVLEEKLRTGNKALDVGSRTGYLTTCMGDMVGNEGMAVGLDQIPQFKILAEQNICQGRPELLDSGRVTFVVGDERSGYPEHGPYDAINVAPGGADISQALIDQLAPGGRLIGMVGVRHEDRNLVQYDRTADGRIKQSLHESLIIVPLRESNIRFLS